MREKSEAPPYLKVAVLREEFVALTKDFKSAIVLNQLLYWAKRTRDFDEFLEEEKRYNWDCDLDLRHGWIRKTASQLIKETLMGCSEQTMRKLLKDLIRRGWIEDEVADKRTINTTRQYRVNLVRLQEDLMKLGYPLEGFPLFQKFKKASSSQNQNDLENGGQRAYSFLSSKGKKPSDFQSFLESKGESDFTEEKAFDLENLSPNDKTRGHIENISRDYNRLSLSTAATKKSDPPESQKNEREMIKVWEEVVLENSINLTQHPKRLQACSHILNGPLREDSSLWRKVCVDVTRSKFFMGEALTSSFKASLDWVLTVENTKKILEGQEYRIGDRDAYLKKHQTETKKSEFLKQEIESSKEPETLKGLRRLFCKIHGVDAHNSWFKDVQLLSETPETLILLVSSQFFKSKLETDYIRDLEEGFSKNSGTYRQIFLECKAERRAA